MHSPLLSPSESHTIALGEALGRLLLPGDILALHGELGAGKTRLVRGLAQGAGADPSRVSSPTFIIMQEYACTGGPVRTLVHIDAYRLSGPGELDTIGWERIARELAERAPIAAVVEWAERIDGGAALPQPRIDIHLAPGPDVNSRRITITAPDSLAARPGWNAVAALATPSRPPTRCPITGKPVPPDSPTYPFFDERARMADLGKWLTGSYSVSRELLPDDDADPGIGDK